MEKDAPKGEPETGDLLLALRHEVRRRILRLMADEKAVSPSDVANQLALPLSNVSYHVRVLADRGAVALVETKPVRGSLQHFYRLAVEAKWVLEALGLKGVGGGKRQ
jgi:DNA-binding transcriptional ArsR family regulator